MQEQQLEPITAKKFMLDHWERYRYDLGIASRRDLLELLNIFQAAGTSLENVYESWQNGAREFLDIFIEADTGAELMESIRSHNAFYTDEEFIDYMLDRINELKADGEDYAEEVKHWTYDGYITDTLIYKTEDGYVVRVWY